VRGTDVGTTAGTSGRHADSYKDLIVYKRAAKVARRIFHLTQGFPREEVYALTDQIRRSSRSVGAQLAEAWAKRRYKRHFISKLTDADAEQRETQHWLDTASECGYVNTDEQEELERQLSEIGRMLNTMIRKADLFCRRGSSGVEESLADYFAGDSSE
jgi:four helix bundle protein